jgi:alkanesulfonate monooxygenase SsuD/methylene tetrahydromethanopterin reductase-like flavin-dependent oxidoreductase (luciferase family)
MGDRPRVLLGGIVPAAFARAAQPMSDGWVAPLFGFELFQEGAATVRDAWTEAGREGAPRIVTGRYFSLGPSADEIADEYIRHYYGDDYFAFARGDTLTDAEQLAAELRRLAEGGCDDVLLYPCSGDLDQVRRLAAALEDAGVPLELSLAGEAIA